MDPLVSALDPLLLTGDRARPGVYDEMVGADRDIRPHWRYLAEALGTLGLPALHDRRRDARRLLRESGAIATGARAPVAARSDPGAGLERRVARDLTIDPGRYPDSWFAARLLSTVAAFILNAADGRARKRWLACLDPGTNIQPNGTRHHGAAGLLSTDGHIPRQT